MEHVAGRAERLAKDKAKGQVPPPFRTRVTESLYGRVYKSDGKATRDQRAKQREVRQIGISKLGEVEYKRLLQEVDLMMKEKVDIDKIIDKRLKEIRERLQSEEDGNQDRIQTRSQAGTFSEQPKVDDGQTAGKRPKTAGKHPKTAEKQPKAATFSEQPKVDDGQTAGKRPKTAGKHPKTAEKQHKASDQDKKSSETPRASKGVKKPKTAKTPQHVDDEELNLDLNTGKPVRKNTRKTTGDNDDIDELKHRSKPQVAKKSAPIPLFEDDDDDQLADLVILEKEQADEEAKDKDYEPEDDKEQEHDNDADEDDFQVPKLKSRKAPVGTKRQK